MLYHIPVMTMVFMWQDKFQAQKQAGFYATLSMQHTQVEEALAGTMQQ
jgi:hypothetical protein